MDQMHFSLGEYWTGNPGDMINPHGLMHLLVLEQRCCTAQPPHAATISDKLDAMHIILHFKLHVVSNC